MRNRFIVIDHTAPVIRQLYLFGGFSWFIHATKIAIDRGCGITSIANSRDEVARTLCIVTAREEARITCHPGFTVYQRNTPSSDIKIEFLGWYPRAIARLTKGRNDGIDIIQYKLTAWNSYRTTAPTRIWITQLVANKLDTADMNPIFTEDLNDGEKIHKFNMLDHGLIDFVFIGWHLFL